MVDSSDSPDLQDSPDARIAVLQAELAALRAEMQEFAYTVSHDLRAPLRHIVSYAQMVQEDAGPQLGAEVQGFLATMTDSARHMGVLLDALAALARLGTVPLALGSVPLQDVVQQVCAELNRRHPGRALDWLVPTDLPVVLADPTLLRQALEHVLGNAVKFTAGRESAVIEINARRGEDGRSTTLQVRDNGVGYNPAMQDKLFRVFGRLHSAKQFEGIGMGLVLTRKIMGRLGGAVSVHGAIDNGCCVELTVAADATR